MLGRVSNLDRVKKGKYQGMQSRLVVWECWYRVVQFSVCLSQHKKEMYYNNLLIRNKVRFVFIAYEEGACVPQNL